MLSDFEHFIELCHVQVAQHLASTYGAKAYDVAKIAQVTGQRWPIVGKRLVSEFPYIEAEVHQNKQVLRVKDSFSRVFFLRFCMP